MLDVTSPCNVWHCNVTGNVARRERHVTEAGLRERDRQSTARFANAWPKGYMLLHAMIFADNK